MTTVVVLVALALIIATRLAGAPSDPPSREQLLRDEEDIAIYGAIVRPPLDEEDDQSRGC